MQRSREELAWAAGFFDGEGTFGAYLGRRHPHHWLQARASLSQVDRRPLERFKAVVGFGSITGPYIRDRRHEHYRYGATRFEHVQALVALLWTFLSPVKREQARRVLVAMRSARSS